MLHVLAEDLRNAVLQAAFEGKLTEQSSSDSVLKLKSSFSGEEPYDLPEAWQWYTLKDIVWNRKQKKPDQTFSYIDIGSIDNEHQRLNDKETVIAADKAPSRARKIVEMGDILYSTVRPYLHNMAIIDKAFEYEPIASTGFAAMVCNEGVLNKYLFNYLKSPYFDKYANDTDNSKGVAYPAINDKKLYAAPIPICSIEEQKRIVDRIDELMAKIDEYEKIEKELITLQKAFPGNMKDSILQAAVQGKLTEQLESESSYDLLRTIRQSKNEAIRTGKIKKEKELATVDDSTLPYDIPDNWVWVRLGDYCEKVTDQVASGSFASLRENVKSLKEPDYALMVKTADFRNNFSRDLTYTDKHGYEFLENSNLYGGELILSNIGSIGKVFIVPHLNQKMTLAPNSVMIRLTDERLRDYLYHFLLSPLGYEELLSITSGTAMKKFNKTDLKTILVPIPPIEEQQRIVEKLDQLLPLCERLEELV